MNDCRHPPANKANRRALHSNDNWQRSDSSFLRRYDRRYAGAEFCAGLALMVASGCHAWRARPVTAPDPSTATRTLRLTTNQGARRLTLERATVRSDSVVGRLVDAADRSGDRWVPDSTIAKGERAAVAVADIGSLEERTESATRTVLLLGLLAALAFAVAFFAVGGPKSR